jgi:hypothetical protein
MTFNESDLIAYQLNELSPRRSRAVRRALAADPALAAEAEAIAWTLRAFSHAPTPSVDAATLDRNWQSLRPSLAVLTAVAATPFWRRPLAVAAGLTLAAAAVIGTGLLTFNRANVRHGDKTASISSRAQPTAGAAAASTVAGAGEASPAQLALNAAPLRWGGGLRSSANIFRESHADSSQSIATDGLTPAQQAAPLADDAAASSTARASAPTSQASGTVAVEAQNAMPAPPLQASTTNSLPMHSPTQTLHNYSATSSNAEMIQLARPLRSPRQREADVSIGVFADASSTGSSNVPTGANSGVSSGGSTQLNTQTIAPAAGVLVAFRQQLRPYAGYQIASGLTRANFTTTASSGTTTQQNLLVANAYEISAAYAVRGPHTHRISSHATAGAGALNFVPSNAAPGVRHVLRPAGLFTLGVDYRLKRHWSLRAEYRALFFKTPSFQNSAGTLPVFNGYTVSSEPNISLNYRFDSLVRP